MTESTGTQTAVKKQHNETMPKLSIDPNSRVYVRLNPLSQSQPMQGEFLGLSHYEFLILRVPSLPGLLNKLIPHTTIEVRFLLDGAVNTFMTELISHSVKPALLLYTSYPDRINVRQTREHQRVNCALPALLNTKYGDARAIITDLSMGGCRVTFGLSGQAKLREITVGDDIVLQTVLNADGMPSGGTAVVRNVEISGNKLHLGLSFNDEHKDFFTSLSAYLTLSRSLL
jgi:PilZ domain.